MFKNNMTWLSEEEEIAVAPGEPPAEQISELRRKGNGGIQGLQSRSRLSNPDARLARGLASDPDDDPLRSPKPAMAF